jgi:hypothetical protein
MVMNPVRTSQRIKPVTITNINLLILSNEIIPVYIENHTESINTKCRATDCYSGWYTYLPFDFKWISRDKSNFGIQFAKSFPYNNILHKQFTFQT